MIFKSKILVILAFGLIMSAGTAISWAQDQVKIVTVSFTIQDAVSMEIDNTNINFGQVSPSKGGIEEMRNAHKIKVKANKKWKLTAQIQDDFKDAAHGFAIPVKQLKVRKTNDNYQAFPSRNATVVIANGEVTTNQGTDVGIDYQLDVLWEHPAGNYSAQIVYTLSVNP